MSKIISYSLFGDSKLYCQGALINADLADKYYPGWKLRYYIAENCPALRAVERTGADVIVMPPTAGVNKDDNLQVWHNDINNNAMLWRFDAACVPGCERVIFRDCDSRLNPREADAVKIWEESGALGHAIYECESHWNATIMGGLCGILGGLFTDIKGMYEYFVNTLYPQYGEPSIFVDLYFLRDMVFSPICFSVLRHGFGTINPLNVPMPEDGSLGRFVGDVVNADWRFIKYV